MRLILTILGLSFLMACTTSNGDISEETETDASSAESESGTIDGGESETGADAPTPSCDAPVGAVVAPFQVSLELPADSEDGVDVELACEILSVTVTDGSISTALDCVGDDGQPQLAALDLPASSEGVPAWGADESVTLAVRTSVYSGGLLDDPTPVTHDVQHVAMHRVADGMLLAAGTAAFGLAPQHYSPVQISLDRDACGSDVPEEEWPGPDRNMAVTFSHDDEVLTLLGGQAGTLSLGDDWFAIDLQRATAVECCHGEDQQVSVVTRLMTAE